MSFNYNLTQWVADTVQQVMPAMNVFGKHVNTEQQAKWDSLKRSRGGATKVGLTWTIEEGQRMLAAMFASRAGDTRAQRDDPSRWDGIDGLTPGAPTVSGALNTRQYGVLNRTDFQRVGNNFQAAFTFTERPVFAVQESDFVEAFFANPHEGVMDGVTHMSTLIDLDLGRVWGTSGAHAVDWTDSRPVSTSAVDGTTLERGLYLTMERLWKLRAEMTSMGMTQLGNDFKCFATADALRDINSLASQIRLPETETMRIIRDQAGYQGDLAGIPFVTTEYLEDFQCGTRIGEKDTHGATGTLGSTNGATFDTAAKVTAARPKVSAAFYARDAAGVDLTSTAGLAVDYLQNAEISVKTNAAAVTAGLNTVKKGDQFSIPGVYAVNAMTRGRLPFLKVFTALADATLSAAGVAIPVHPRPIAEGPYQNVSLDSTAQAGTDTAANRATIKVDAPLNFFGLSGGLYQRFLFLDKTCLYTYFDIWMNNPVQGRTAGKFAPRGGASFGQTTLPDSNIRISVASDFDILSGVELMRFDGIYGRRVLNGADKCCIAWARKLN